MSDAGPDVARAVRRGVRRFNLGSYRWAHRVWEDAWHEATTADRAFLEGLVQLATGLHLRTRRGATRGTIHLVSQAMVRLEEYRPSAHGVDVERLLDDFTGYLDWLKQVHRPHRFGDRWRVPRLR